MRHLKFVAVLMFVLAIGGRWAYADTISTFSLNTGTHQGGSIAGEIEIDVTTGLAGYGSFTLYTHDRSGHLPDEAVPFNAYFETTCFGCEALPTSNTNVMSATANNHSLVIEVVATTLIGYTGGPLCYGTAPATECNGGGAGSGWDYATQEDERLLPADLVLVSSVTTPEPGSFVLLGTGLLGVGGLVRRRLRRS